MGKFYDDIPQPLFEWIKKQRMFWVATAPLSAQGHINLSPKGTADCFHLVNAKRAWYEDLTGSGNVYLVCSRSAHTEPKRDCRCRNHLACAGEWADNGHVLCFRRSP